LHARHCLVIAGYEVIDLVPLLVGRARDLEERWVDMYTCLAYYSMHVYDLDMHTYLAYLSRDLTTLHN
jgi:hypothetical protein